MWVFYTVLNCKRGGGQDVENEKSGARFEAYSDGPKQVWAYQTRCKKSVVTVNSRRKPNQPTKAKIIAFECIQLD